MGSDKLAEQLTRYAGYHRDRRNVITHMVGIPMIVLAVVTLLSRPDFTVMQLSLAPATVLTVAACIYYLVMDSRLGILLTVWLLASLAIATCLARQTTAIWVTSALSLFITGWILQFIGHFFEGRKPAFFDDLRSLSTGPVFVAQELLKLFSASRNRH